MQRLDQADIGRIVRSMIRSRLAQLRCVSPASIVLADDQWSLPLSDSLAVDSLELLELASEVGEFFHLHDTRLDDSLLLQPQLDVWVRLIHEHANQQAFSFYTSGSTGDPKLCTHQAADLWQEIEFFSTRIKFQRLISLVPEHHIYGFLWTVLLPKHRGVEVISGATASRVASGNSRAGDLIVATPPVWDYLLRSTPKMPPGTLGVSSTAPLPATTATRLRNGTLHRLYEIYGASETAAVGFRANDSAQYQLLPYLRRRDHVSLTRLCVDGSATTIELQDHLSFTTADSFSVLGRRDRVVQVGGHNVSLDGVAAKLKEHADIVEVALAATEQAGKLRLVAQIHSVKDLSAAQQGDIGRWCRTVLPPHQVPALTFS